MVIVGPKRKQPLKPFEPRKPEFSDDSPFLEPQKRPIGDRIKTEAQGKLEKKPTAKAKEKQPATSTGAKKKVRHSHNIEKSRGIWTNISSREYYIIM